jgi:cytochrome P450
MMCSKLISILSQQTSTSLTNFFLAMMYYPEIQVKAHKLLDEVVGRSRLPDFTDMDQLQYITAVVKETLRWKAVAPLGNIKLHSP